MPKTPNIVTRQETTSSNSADNLNKGSKLTFAEMDSNFIELKNGSIGVVADDSATIDVKHGDTLYIQGGDNVTTSTDSAGVVTINATGGDSLGDLTAVGSTISSPSNADITLDPSGTGSVSINADLSMPAIEIHDNNIKATRTNDDLVLETNNTGSVIVRADMQIGDDAASGLNHTTMTAGNNRSVALVGGSTGGTVRAMPGPGNGTGETGDIELTPASGGNVDITSGDLKIGTATYSTNSITLDQLQWSGNTLTTTQSNANLRLNTSGTGKIQLGDINVEPDNSNKTGYSAFHIPFSGDGSTYQDFYIQMMNTAPEIYFNNADDNPGARIRVGTGSLAIQTDGSNSSTGNIRLQASGDITLAPSGNLNLGSDTIVVSGNKMFTDSSNEDFELLANGTGNISMLSQANMNSNKIVNVTDPTADQDAATKAYVDSQDGNIASDTLTFTNKSGNISQWTNDSNYLTSVSQSDVTQHQAALSITESQISDLGSYITDANITLVGDDSTGVSFSAKNNDDIKIAGGTNITTAVAGNTVTITGPDLSSYITDSSTSTLTNKTIDANGTGNSISNIEVADFAGSAIINVAETLASNDSDTALVTAGAIIDYVDAQDANIASDTLTFTNKTFDVEGTGNSISNIDVADFKAAAIVTAAEGIGSNNNDTTIPTSAAVKAYADSVGGGGSTGDLTITGSTISAPSNASLTLQPGGTGNVVIDGLTYPGTDGTNGQVLTTDGAGNLTFTTVSGGAASTGDFTFTGNNMSTSSSNADMELGTSGTGAIVLKANGGDISNSNFSSGNRYDNANILWYEDLNHTAGTKRVYANTAQLRLKFDGTDSGSSNARFRAFQAGVDMDINGTALTNTGSSRGPNGVTGGMDITNTSASTGSFGALSAVSGYNYFYDYGGSAGDIDITNAYGFRLYSSAEFDGIDGSVTNAYGSHVGGPVAYSYNNTNLTVTNSYGYYYNHNPNNATFTNDPYAFYTNDDSVRSNPGALNKFNEYSYNATHSSGGAYTIDWANGNLQTVTLTSNITGFTMSNFPTSTKQSVGVTLYLVQDGTGSRSMTFSATGGETFKFANGATTSSVSSANDIQTVYIFSRYTGSANIYYWTLGPTYS